MNYYIPAGIPYLQRVDEIMVWKVSTRYRFRLKDRSGFYTMVETLSLLFLHIPKLCPWCEGWLLMGLSGAKLDPRHKVLCWSLSRVTNGVGTHTHIMHETVSAMCLYVQFAPTESNLPVLSC